MKYKTTVTFTFEYDASDSVRSSGVSGEQAHTFMRKGLERLIRERLKPLAEVYDFRDVKVKIESLDYGL